MPAPSVMGLNTVSLSEVSSYFKSNLPLLVQASLTLRSHLQLQEKHRRQKKHFCGLLCAPFWMIEANLLYVSGFF